MKSMPCAAELKAVDCDAGSRSAGLAALGSSGPDGGSRLIGEEEPRESPARLLFTEGRRRHPRRRVIERDTELSFAVPETHSLMSRACSHRLCRRGLVRHLALLPAGRGLFPRDPGAGSDTKRWPVERYAKCAGLIGRGFRVLVNAGPQ